MLKEIRKTIEKSEQETKKTRNKLDLLCDSFASKRENIEEIDKTRKKLTKQVLTKYYLLENEKHAFLEENAPKVLEILKKYNGKPYGEKTREKARQEAKEKHNIGFYIDTRYNTSDIVIYDLDKNGYHSCGHDVEVKLYGKYNEKNILDEKNRICIDAEYNTTTKYNENINEKIKEVIKAKREAYEAITKAEELTKKYNALLPEKLRTSEEITINVKNNYRPHFDFSSNKYI